MRKVHGKARGGGVGRPPAGGKWVKMDFMISIVGGYCFYRSNTYYTPETYLATYLHPCDAPLCTRRCMMGDICMCRCMHARTIYTYMYVRIYVCNYYTHTHTHACMHSCMHIHTHVLSTGSSTSLPLLVNRGNQSGG